MTKFAARFGRTRQNLSDDPDLHFRLMVRYAREHGHDPTGLAEWVMFVAEDGTVEFYPYWVPEDDSQTYDRGWTDRTPLKQPPDRLDDE